MSTLGKAVIEFSADTATFVGDVGKAAAQFSKSMDQMQAGIARLGVELAGIVSIGGFAAMIKGSIDAADKLGDLSKSTGIAVETLGGLGFAASQSGSSVEGVGKAVGKLNVHIAEAKSGVPEMVKLFQNVGLSIKDLNTLSPDQVFARIADKFAANTNAANAAAYGNKFFGKSYQEIIPTLDEGGDKIRQNVEYYQKYSGVTEEVARKSDEFNDQLTKLHLLSGAFANVLAGKLLDPMKEVVDQLVQMKEKSDSTVTAVNGIIEVLKIVAVVGAETSFTFTTIGKEMSRFAENVKLVASGDWEGSKRLGKMFAEDAAQGRKEVDALTARIMAFNTVKSKTGGDLEWDHGVPGKPRKSDLPNIPVPDAPVSLFTRTMQSLTKEYYNLTNAGKLATILWEEQNGTLKKLNPEERAQVEAKARLIDAYRNLALVQQEAVRLAELMTQTSEAARVIDQEYTEGRRRDIEDLQFQNSLVGQSAAAQEQMNALRRIDLELRAKIASLPKNELDDQSAAIIKFNKDAQDQTRAVQTLIANRQALERSWGTGVQQGMQDYVAAATDAAAASRKLFTDTFQGMEDALVKFTTTGKVDVKSMANSIIEDLARIQIRQNITAPLAAASGDWFKSLGDSLFGGFRAQGGDVDAGTSYVVGENGREIFTPDVAGSITPTNQIGGGGAVYIDARGADPAGLARVEAMIRRVGASIVPVALGAVRGAYNARGRTTPMG